MTDWPVYRGSGEVPNAPLREAFERSGMSKGELATRMGWARPNVDRVNRALGYRPDTGSRDRPPRPRQLLTYEMALKLCSAIGADPHECGI